MSSLRVSYGSPNAWILPHAIDLPADILDLLQQEANKVILPEKVRKHRVAKVPESIIIGINAITRLLSSERPVHSVLVATDSGSPLLFLHLAQLCAKRRIPVVTVKAAKKLSSIFQVPRFTALALLPTAPPALTTLMTTLGTIPALAPGPAALAEHAATSSPANAPAAVVKRIAVRPSRRQRAKAAAAAAAAAAPAPTAAPAAYAGRPQARQGVTIL